VLTVAGVAPVVPIVAGVAAAVGQTVEDGAAQVVQDVPSAVATTVAVVATPVVAIEPLVERKLRSVAPASSLHRSLIEVVRRQYKVFCQDRDRADKEAIRAARAEAPK
jgi:hypothetical protein